MPHVSENFSCSVIYDISSFTSSILQDGKILKIDADAMVKSYASVSETIEIVSDAFSTKFGCKTSTEKINVVNSLKPLNENIELNESFPAMNLKKIVDLNAEISNLENEQTNNKIKFKAKLKINAYGFSNDDTPDFYEKTVPISFEINKNLNPNNNQMNIGLNIEKLEFSLDENQNLNLKINFQLNGLVNSLNEIDIIDKIDLDEKELKPKSTAALTLFYPQPNDNIWEIAKRFSACPNDIMEANKLTNETITDEIMLIIPTNSQMKQ